MSHDKFGLWQLGITHVLNAAHGKMCCKGSDDFYGTTVKYHGVPASDLPTFNLSPFFYTSALFIHEGLTSGGTVNPSYFWEKHYGRKNQECIYTFRQSVRVCVHVRERVCTCLCNHVWVHMPLYVHIMCGSVWVWVSLQLIACVCLCLCECVFLSLPREGLRELCRGSESFSCCCFGLPHDPPSPQSCVFHSPCSAEPLGFSQPGLLATAYCPWSETTAGENDYPSYTLWCTLRLSYSYAECVFNDKDKDWIIHVINSLVINTWVVSQIEQRLLQGTNRTTSPTLYVFESR